MSLNIPPEEAHAFNPYAAPHAQIGLPPALFKIDTSLDPRYGELLGDAASVKAVGIFYYFAAIVFFFFAGVVAASATFAVDVSKASSLLTPGAVLAGSIFGLLAGAIGFGLRSFKQWARWTAVALSSLAVAACLWGLVSLPTQLSTLSTSTPAGALLLVCIAFNLCIIAQLASVKRGKVFSREYREVIANTPHVGLETSRLTRGIAAFVVIAIIVAIIAGYLGMRR